MVKEEISKYNTIYKIYNCDPDIIIPTNDLDAWMYYKEENWIYNRLLLSQLQEIDAAPMPILPEKYPVIMKPIINLYGMGLNVKKINDKNEFMENWYSNDFWEEYLEGDHISIDILMIKGEIQWYCAFQGYKSNNLGSFKYWESIEFNLTSNIIGIISKLKNFTGCINLEMINDKIIEGHLRMGDITKLPDEKIIRGIISIYKGIKFDSFPKTIPKIYLFPVWMSAKTDNQFLHNLDPKVINKICQKAYSYQIDRGTEAYPSDLRRIMMVTTLDYNVGIKILSELYHYIHSI